MYKAVKIPSKKVERKIKNGSSICKVSWHQFWLNTNLFIAVCGQFRQAFLYFKDQNKWLRVTLDRWLSYTVGTVQEFSWTDLKFLYRWLSKLDWLYIKNKNSLFKMLKQKLLGTMFYHQPNFILHWLWNIAAKILTLEC